MYKRQPPYAEGAGDISELRLQNETLRFAHHIDALAKLDVPTTSIFITGRPLSVNRFINASDAFVVAWLPGTEAHGIADLIIGDINKNPRYDFTAKLPFSWPSASKKHSGETKHQENQDLFTRSQAQFEYGYGLNYRDSSQLAQLRDYDFLQPTQYITNGKLPIFIKQVKEPFSLYIGDEDNWSINVAGNQGSTANNKSLTVSATDSITQEDARKIEWSDDKYAQIYFQYQHGIDISGLADNDAYLAFNVKVDMPPKKPVDLRMDCSYPCTGKLDVSTLLLSMPPGHWQSVAVDLDCFANEGAELSQIDTPFLMGTSGPLRLEISDIRIETDSIALKRMDCSQYTAQLLNR